MSVFNQLGTRFDIDYAFYIHITNIYSIFLLPAVLFIQLDCLDVSFQVLKMWAFS